MSPNRDLGGGSDDVPAPARQLAGRLAEAFEQDQALAEQQNSAQHRLQAANGDLWSGLHPDALSRSGSTSGQRSAVGSLR